MYISAFLHKNELFELTNRWLSNQLEKDDPLQITRIITYDSFTAWERLLLFVKEMNRYLPGLAFHERISTKKELKDFICASASESPPPRTRQLIEAYRAMPEYYYIGSPITALVFHDEKGRLTGMCRFKRVKRIAEKASRYATRYITERIREAALKLAAPSGSCKQPTRETMALAERDILPAFKANGLRLPKKIMTIKDVLGLKLIQNGISVAALEDVLSRLPGTTIIEKEVHSGNYNATHYVVELIVDPAHIRKRFRERPGNGAYRYRGLPATRLTGDFNRFLETGARTVQVDLIFTTLEEMIESEIGRSMHETRIVRQRRVQDGCGNITTNIEYIIEFLLAVGMSPATRIDEIPIKIWGRYLPDTLSNEIRKLYRLPEYSIVDH
jgi:hypothetical protein